MSGVRSSRTGLLVAAIVACLLGILPGTAQGASIVAPAAGPGDFLDGITDSGVAPGWRLRAGALYSDNLTREPEDGESGTISVAEFGANWNYKGPRLAAAFDGTIARRHYSDEIFDDETRANFLAAADWFILPDTLDFYVMDRAANAPIDPLGSTNPANVQLINVLETGPRLTLRPGAGNELTIALARAEVRAEETPIDHARDSATLGFSRTLSANSTLGVIATGSEVDFDESAEAQDFKQAAAHLEFRSRSNTMNLSVAGGRSEVELADGFSGDSGTGWLRLGLRRSSDSFLYFALERRAGDTASAMLRNELLLEQGGSPFIVSGDPFFADTAVLRYSRNWRAHEWYVEAGGRRIDYFLSPLDQEGTRYGLGTTLLLSPRLSLDVSAYQNDIKYSKLDRDDSYSAVQTEVDFSLNRRWSVVGGLNYFKRDSDAQAFGFDELMLTLFLSYAPQDARRQGRRR